MSLAERVRQAVPKRWRVIALSLLAGLAPALAHPPFGFWPGLAGFGLLMVLLDRADLVRPLRSAFWRGWLAGTAYFLVCTWWVGEAFLVDVEAHGWQAPFAVGFLAGGLGLLWGAAGAIYRRIAPPDSKISERDLRERPVPAFSHPALGVKRVLVFAAVFAVVEWLRGHILTGFPWDLPGEAWRAGGWISQGASIIGAYGLSVVTLAIAATVGLLLAAPKDRRSRIGAGSALAALVLLAVFGAARLATPLPKAQPIRVRVVQANIDQVVKWTPQSFRLVFDTYTGLTRQAPAAGQPWPQVVIWPESAIPADSGAYLAEGSWTHDALLDALRPGQILIMGAVRSEGFGLQARYYNSVLALRRDPAGLTPLATYDKHHLVPFGEYMPMDSLMGAIGFKTLVHVGDGFTEGPRPAPMQAPGLPPLQALICYESLFPTFVADDHPRPAWIANVSNDAWFGKTSGPWQHLNLASYRAIEEGLPMIRSTPTGVSAVIDAYGRPLSMLGQGERGVIDADLPAAAPPTAYRTLRDWPFWLMVFGGLACALPLRRRPRPSTSSG